MVDKLIKLKELYFSKKFLIDCILLSVLFFVNSFLSIFTYFSFTLLFVLVLTSNIKSSISYIFFTIPFSCINMNSSVILFLVCTINCIVRLCIEKFYKNRYKIDKKILITCAIFWLMCCFLLKMYIMRFYF